MTNLTMPDISPSNSQFFEVMYVGKIKVSHKRVPFTFIDDALPKFKAYETQRMRMQANARRASQDGAIVPDKSSLNNRRHSANDEAAIAAVSANRNNSLAIAEEDDAGADESAESSTVRERKESFQQKILDTKLNEESKENSVLPREKFLLRGQSQSVIPVKQE